MTIKQLYFPHFFSTASTVRGVTRIFQSGGHTLSNRGYSLDCHVDLHAAPLDPPPPPIATALTLRLYLC